MNEATLRTMPAAYSNNFRLAVIRQVQLGQSVSEVASYFNINRTTVYEYMANSGLTNKYANCS